MLDATGQNNELIALFTGDFPGLRDVISEVCILEEDLLEMTTTFSSHCVVSRQGHPWSPLFNKKNNCTKVNALPPHCSCKLLWPICISCCAKPRLISQPIHPGINVSLNKSMHVPT